LLGEWNKEKNQCFEKKNNGKTTVKKVSIRKDGETQLKNTRTEKGNFSFMRATKNPVSDLW